MRPDAFWQEFLPPETDLPPPWTHGFPARLDDGRVLILPIRPLAGTNTAIASLILNQAAFSVEDALADILARRLQAHAPEIVVGIPTLGLSLARGVARRLGHDRFVALGTSRKFWFDDALSAPMSSITSPGTTKRLYLDPRMTDLLAGRRIALIDDVISTGASMQSGLAVLGTAGQRPIALGAAMLQTERWKPTLDTVAPTEGVLVSPLLKAVAGGWDLY